MLRYKTETRPGLVALYDIRPGNGVGPFLQPRSPHGAAHTCLQGRTFTGAHEQREYFKDCELELLQPLH